MNFFDDLRLRGRCLSAGEEGIRGFAVGAVFPCRDDARPDRRVIDEEGLRGAS